MRPAKRGAVWKGLITSPPPRLRREGAIADSTTDQEYVAAEVFTLQWHLTQECDLHCRHCYDRTNRRSFPFERALTLLDELRDFCRSRFVRGQVSLSGGNPLLYPQFMELYRAAAERDFMIAILGNASDRATVEELVAIQMPVYYQVSLEGLEQHNDEIRGTGNYRRTVDFLRTLTEMGVPNMVMLTLTRHNMGQVIPLAEALEGVTGGLTFNRLALFGEGASLELPTPEEYREFLEEYAAALDSHPVLKLKDSLLNTIFECDDSGLFGGCAGYGCGAAFNFVSILPDGEVHACRKFPSSIGTVIGDSLENVYSSATAHRYRAGSSACTGCSLNAVCRGCPAVTASLGLDPFSAKDPFCFRSTPD
jgi:selenobiotic family peptide radical SAM maturase